MLLSEKIIYSETKYKKILEEFFSGIFSVSFLPSHGIEHHHRVWHYVKEILQCLDENGFETDQILTDKLIITCFLHDSGMAIDSGFRHGVEGRKLCERFLHSNSLSLIEFSDVLNAIEYHDNKEYVSPNQPDDLLTILTVADDLDAFGFIGIYRYLEIYLERNKPVNELGTLIIENCMNRFNHFLRTYGFNSSLVEKHSKRYEIINSFFTSYNQSAPFYDFDNQLTAGYCGIVEIMQQSVKNKLSQAKLNSILIESPDPVIQWFGAELKYELDEFSRG
jgi:hypothetical protein